jgi:hypothetical protein
MRRIRLVSSLTACRRNIRSGMEAPNVGSVSTSCRQISAPLRSPGGAGFYFERS